MKCLTNKECLEWLESHNIDATSPEGWPEVVGDFEILFAAPKDARMQALLARDTIAWLGEFETALFWLSDWVFYKPDEMALILAFRRGHREDRLLIEAPGHLFDFKERYELIGWISLMVNFGWDGHLYVSPFRGSMLQTSHEDFVWLLTSDADQFRKAQMFVSERNLKIHRVTEL